MSKTLSVDVPREIAGYKILNQIGEGGMARVFKGRNELGGVAAVKVINPYYQHDPGFRERFRREAGALTQVEHEGVVRILQWVDENNTLAMIMEYLNGLAFNRYLDNVFGREEGENKIITPEDYKISENLRIMRDVAVAMSHVHRKGVCHRDLKPDNIIIVNSSRGNLAKIIDFGICHPQGSPRRTRVGLAIGTPGYMAPEQIIPSKEIDNRTDIYALGLILFEAYTGLSIFTGHAEELDAQYQLMRNEEFVISRIEEESIPPHVAPIIKRCLKFKIEERYPFMDQIVGALDLSLEQSDHYLIGRVSLLTKKKNQNDIPTVESSILEDAASGIESAMAAAEKKSSQKKRSVLKTVSLALVLLLAVLALSAGLFYRFGQGGIYHEITAKPTERTERSAEAVMAAVKKPAETVPVDLLKRAESECLALSLSDQNNPGVLTSCLMRKAWSLYEQLKFEQAIVLAKHIEAKYWNQRDWRFRKEVKHNIKLVFRLLGKLYRHKSSTFQKYSYDWNLLARNAAHYEQMVRNLSD